MASKLKLKQTTSSQSATVCDDDDDFQDACHSLPLTQRPLISNNASPPRKSGRISSSQRYPPPLKPSNSAVRPRKRSKGSTNGKENRIGAGGPCSSVSSLSMDSVAQIDTNCSLESIESRIDCSNRGSHGDCLSPEKGFDFPTTTDDTKKTGLKFGYSSNSIESRLVTSIVRSGPTDSSENMSQQLFEPCTQLNVLLDLCTEEDLQNDEFPGSDFGDSPIHCPLCGTDISHLSDELRQVHTNECLDKEETPNVVLANDDSGPQCPGHVLDSSPVRSHHKVVDTSPVMKWLRSLGLGKYEEIFAREEIDWDSLQWLTDEDLVSMGVTALGPRKKIVHALSEFRKDGANTVEMNSNAIKVVASDPRKLAGNKLITEFFPGSVAVRRKSCTNSTGGSSTSKNCSSSGTKQVSVNNIVTKKKFREIPLWCCIPGTPFRVDAFKYLRRDCSHWFLSHFHMDHYQGLTKSFCHGMIYCSLITAKLVNMKMGIPWDKLQVLPINQKINIAGVNVTCFDANHCPGAVIILFEPPNGKAVLHTGDFRFDEDISKISVLQTCSIQTLILDTTYCNPQYDFPKQEAVIQFVIEAIQAEAFNPKTLFLIGSYTVGKERLFLEVARVLRKKVYVTAAKLQLLKCLGLPEEDMQWLTLNEQESHIHVVPMWTIANFKRLKHTSTHYASRYSLIVAFSPTGWSFGKGTKKSTPGRRSQQGTIIRYEVPYSEHSSFIELKEFVKFISAVNIIPSVNNNGPESCNQMLSLLLS